MPLNLRVPEDKILAVFQDRRYPLGVMLVNLGIYSDKSAKPFFATLINYSVDTAGRIIGHAFSLPMKNRGAEAVEVQNPGLNSVAIKRHLKLALPDYPAIKADTVQSSMPILDVPASELFQMAKTMMEQEGPQAASGEFYKHILGATPKQKRGLVNLICQWRLAQRAKA